MKATSLRIGGLAALSWLVGCASSRLVLQTPIAEQCTSAGLEGCPALTEGVLLFVEGDQATLGKSSKKELKQTSPTS
jgi:hypothetical protein